MRINGTDIALTRGDTAIFSLEIRDIDDELIQFEKGDKVYFTVKTSTETTNIIFQKIINIAYTQEEIVIDIEPDDTKDLRYKDYVYDIQYNRANGEVHTVVPVSKFTVAHEVTYD